MTRRMTKKESQAIGLLIVVGIIFAALGKLFEAVGFVLPGILVVVAVGLYCWNKSHKKKQRLASLRDKYKEEDIVQKIFAGYFWQGQSEDQLIDSLGQPADINHNVLKTKKKEVWKYGHQGGNRYRLRITLENDIVVGWDQKA
jgi:membrane protein required for beta-lactamase induction